MNSLVLLAETGSGEMISPPGYLIGTILALCILGYLLYAMVNPEKF